MRSATHPFFRSARIDAACSAAGTRQRPEPDAGRHQERGELLCSGATVNSPGFAVVDAKGEWKGLDVDICRALAVAILGDDTKMKLVP